MGHYLRSSGDIGCKTDWSEVLKCTKEDFWGFFYTKGFTPRGQGPLNSMGSPRFTKKQFPLRPIVSSIGAVSYETSKELARILKPLVRKSPYHVHNTQDFIQQIKDINLGEDQCIMSYDVKALFTSVPIQPAISIIAKLLEDQELQQRTSLSVKNITSLLEFCLKSTYFIFQGRYFEQQGGAAMGSPISPIVANLYMEDFEIRAINSSPQPPIFGEDLWMTPLPSSSHHRKQVFWNI